MCKRDEIRVSWSLLASPREISNFSRLISPINWIKSHSFSTAARGTHNALISNEIFDSKKVTVNEAPFAILGTESKDLIQTGCSVQQESDLYQHEIDKSVI